MSALGSWAGDTAVRAVKTAAQTLFASLGASASGVLPTTLSLEADLKLAGLAAAACVLHNVVGMPNPWSSTSSPTATLEPAGPTVQVAGPVLAPAELASTIGAQVALAGLLGNGTAHAGAEAPAGPTEVGTAPTAGPA